MEDLLTTTVSFTDEEFAAVMASLELSVKSANKYLEDNGQDSLDEDDKETFKKIEDLFDRLIEEHFE